MRLKVVFLHLVLIVSFFQQAGSAATTPHVVVQTQAPNNRELKIWYRVPRHYHEKQVRESRVLVIFGGRNTGGERWMEKGKFTDWADANHIFLVSPSYRDDQYWHPEGWSGRALMKGLNAIKEKYRINTDKLLYFGLSAGARCANFFAAWRPGNTRAWAAYASSSFHIPHVRMKRVPGLVACGDADGACYVPTRKFIDLCREKRLPIIWKTYQNTPHGEPDHFYDLAMAFLGYYHKLYESELIPGKKPFFIEEKALYAGDDLEQRFYPIVHPKTSSILSKDKVYFTSKEIAEVWGQEG